MQNTLCVVKVVSLNPASASVLLAILDLHLFTSCFIQEEWLFKGISWYS